MDSHDYYEDTKYCARCDRYVHYLQSIHACYCTSCGDQVRLFSKEDWEAFKRSGERPKGKRRLEFQRKTE